MISVIIPVYNSEKVIKDCLSSLLSQNYPRNKYEIVVVDDGSKDRTCEIINKFKGVKLVKQKHMGPAAARNLGVKKAKGNIILFTDSDCIPSRNWIREITKPFKNQEVVGVSGTYKTYNKESIIARFAGYEIEERHKKLIKQKTIDFIGTFSAGYRKNIFLKFGGFNESFPIASGEDPELSFKISNARLKMVFQPKAFVYHRHPDTLRKFLRQKFWRGYWRILLYKKHPKKIFKHSYTPKILYGEIFLTGLTAVLLFLTIFNLIPILFPLVFFLLTFLFTLPLSFSIIKKDVAVGILSPFIIILRNFFTGTGIVYGFLSNLVKRL